MILNSNLKSQTLEYLKLLDSEITFEVSLDQSTQSNQLKNFLEELCTLDNRLTIKEVPLEYTPSFRLRKTKDNQKGRITFAGTPLGHEYNTFILALLQVGGKIPKITPQQIETIKSIDEPLHFKTYVSLTCHNCPDTAQAINYLSIINSNISSTIIIGETFQEEINTLEIMGVPSTILNNQFFLTGKNDLTSILEKLGQKHLINIESLTKKLYDIIIIGNDPCGINLANKASCHGLKVGILNFENNSQNDNENLLRNLSRYNINFFNIKIKKIIQSQPLQIILEDNLILRTNNIIISTGHKWKKLGIPGEQRLLAKGVSYCIQCDIPLFKNKKIAIIGNEKLNIETWKNILNTATEITLFNTNFKQKSKNKKIRIINDAYVEEITGLKKVESLIYTDLHTNEEHELCLDGIFIQNGSKPNTEWIKNIIDCNDKDEIITDSDGKTNIKNIYAIGECASNKFAQIIIQGIELNL